MRGCERGEDIHLFNLSDGEYGTKRFATGALNAPQAGLPLWAGGETWEGIQSGRVRCEGDGWGCREPEPVTGASAE